MSAGRGEQIRLSQMDIAETSQLGLGPSQAMDESLGTLQERAENNSPTRGVQKKYKPCQIILSCGVAF